MNKNIDSVTSKTGQSPDPCLVIPCYNEEGSLWNTVLQLVKIFREKNINVELVLVDNGSVDKTRKIIDEVIAEGLPVVKETLEHNQGYGYAVLHGYDVSRSEQTYLETAKQNDRVYCRIHDRAGGD